MCNGPNEALSNEFDPCVAIPKYKNLVFIYPLFIKKHINERKLKTLANAIGLESKELMEAYLESDFKNRFEGILVDNHISSNIRKISKIRDKLASDSMGLYITDEKFNYYSNKNIIKKIGQNDYFIDFEKLN